MVAPENIRLGTIGQSLLQQVDQTQDDRIEYAYAYALALKRAKVPAELHVYATGGHGFGMRKAAGAVSAWPKLAEEWMKANKWIN